MLIFLFELDEDQKNTLSGIHKSFLTPEQECLFLKDKAPNFNDHRVALAYRSDLSAIRSILVSQMNKYAKKSDEYLELRRAWHHLEYLIVAANQNLQRLNFESRSLPDAQLAPEDLLQRKTAYWLKNLRLTNRIRVEDRQDTLLIIIDEHKIVVPKEEEKD